MKRVAVFISMMLAPAALFAADGQVLINQSTVMAAGGFPYIISSPGSYKLSGNLQMTTTTRGNYAGADIAIAINSSNVDLDLNGFSIIVTNTDVNFAHNLYVIAEIGTFSQVSIKNGTISVKSIPIINPGPSVNVKGIHLPTTTQCKLVDLSIFGRMYLTLGGVFFGFSIDIGPFSLVRDNVMRGAVVIACPSLFVENFGVGDNDLAGCTGIHNSP